MNRVFVAALVVASTSTAAARGPKELPPLAADGYVPVLEGDLDALRSRLHCVEADTRGAPRLQPCASGLEAVLDTSACGERWCEDREARPAASRFGLTSWGPAWLGVDHALTETRTVRPADTAALGLKELIALGEVCEDAAARALVTAVHLGCGRAMLLGGYQPGDGLPAIKTTLATAPARGQGRFVTDPKAADLSTCEGEPVVVAVSTTPVAELCAAHVAPALVGRLRAQLAEVETRAPDGDDPRAALFLDLGRVRSRRENILGDIEGTRALLTRARSDLGAARTAIDAVKRDDDQAFIVMLTELERLTTGISEMYVSLSSLEERAEAFGKEGSHLEENLAFPGLDAVHLAMLGDEIVRLVERGKALAKERTELRQRVEAMDRAVGVLQGQVASL